MSKDLSILIIERNVLVGKLYKAIFEDVCDVNLAYNCEEGIEKFSKEPCKYDGIITDLYQNTKNSVNIIYQIRRSKNPNIPIYIISGNSNYDFIKEAMSLVTDRFIEKPFTSSELKNKFLKDVIYHKKNRDSSNYNNIL